MGPRVPDAWDDDFQEHADKKEQSPPKLKARQTKAERRAQHAELQRALWNSADDPAEPTPFHLMGSNAAPPPLAGGFKPTVTLLSRKPKPDAAKPAGEDEPDSEEEARRKAELDVKARTERARAQREEKARHYAEVRSRLFPEDEKPATPAPGSPGRGQRSGQGSNGIARGQRGGKSRGARAGGGSPSTSTRNSSADQSPAGGSTPGRTLFDPEYVPRPGSSTFATGLAKEDSAVLRQPRGPDSAGRGFARRGGGGLQS